MKCVIYFTFEIQFKNIGNGNKVATRAYITEQFEVNEQLLCKHEPLKIRNVLEIYQMSCFIEINRGSSSLQNNISKTKHFEYYKILKIFLVTITCPYKLVQSINK